MPDRVELFTSYKILSFSFKISNVKIKAGLIAAGDELIV